MAYALMQKELSPPPVDALKRAFSISPALTDLDAQTAAHDAFGLLLRGLEIEQASALQDALLKEKVDTIVAEESELPAIPPAKCVRQVEFMPSHLTLYDPMARSFTLPWSDILLLAAGQVRVQEFKRPRSTHEEPQFHGVGISADTGAAGRAREESHLHFLLEIVLRGGVARYTVTADEFVFNHLGGRLTPDLSANFKLLLQELAQSAPDAGLNRGAFLACQTDTEPWFSYPSKAAFYQEITWMLWRIGQLSRGEGI